MLRLNTFVISHFSEKARWALDLNGIAFTERLLLPGPHLLVIKRLAKGTTVPLLEHDGTVVQGSSKILDYLEQRLGATRLAAPPGQEQRAAELEATADRAFGLGTQRIFYDTLLENREIVIDMWTQNGPWWGRAYFAVAFPVVAHLVRRTYKIRPDAVQRAKDLFRRTMDTTDQALAKGPYLLGDTLSRADVTVAALLAPLCTPPEHVLRWPTEIPPEHAAFVEEFKGRPTWDFVLRMYREHRREGRSR
ncbi:MAG: glutathione S-transferase family protein [Byssovorax sp.]